jgi:splicing factor 45
MHCKITNINIFFAAVVDLNGRFFGGRQVKAGFYSWEKLNNLELLD